MQDGNGGNLLGDLPRTLALVGRGSDGGSVLIPGADVVLRDCGDWPWHGLGSWETLNMWRAKIRVLATTGGGRRQVSGCSVECHWKVNVPLEL